MIQTVVHILFLLLFAYLLITILYLFIAALAGKLPAKTFFGTAASFKKIAVLITSFKEDEVIVNTVRSAVSHNYNRDFFRVFLAADQLKPETLHALHELNATIIEVHFERGSKARSLNHLLNIIPENEYEIAMVLDGDNIMMPGCLAQVNNVFSGGSRAVQVHRVAKNTDSSIAILDAISEEINNHLFRKAQRKLGFSASTIGSGMAFEFSRLKAVYNKPGILDNPACDREVDFEMMKQGIVVEYLDNVHVLDEKVSGRKVFENQRRRWLESQLIHLGLFFSGKELVKNKTKDYWNKLFINLLPPRVLFLGLILLVFIILCINYYNKFNISPIPYPAWASVFLLYFLSLLLSIPDRYFTLASLKALLTLPVVLFTFLKATFSLKPKRKEFVHTPKTFTSGDGGSPHP